MPRAMADYHLLHVAAYSAASCHRRWPASAPGGRRHSRSCLATARCLHDGLSARCSTPRWRGNLKKYPLPPTLYAPPRGDFAADEYSSSMGDRIPIFRYCRRLAPQQRYRASSRQRRPPLAARVTPPASPLDMSAMLDVAHERGIQHISAFL